MHIDIAWIREGEQFTHIGADIEKLIGWPLKDALKQPRSSLFAPSTLRHLEKHYYVGPPDSIRTHSCPVWLIHRAGHKICCHCCVICRYDSNGSLAEAWGHLYCGPYQSLQNEVIDWWEQATQEDIKALSHMVEACHA